MPLPNDDKLDETINSLYDSVLDRAIEPGQFGIVTGKSARLQAASQRRLALAIDRATDAQEKTNKRIERLEHIGIAIAFVGALLAVVQIIVAVLQLRVR